MEDSGDQSGLGSHWRRQRPYPGGDGEPRTRSYEKTLPMGGIRGRYKMSIRAVIDTSALVTHGSRQRLQEAAEDQKFTAIWSPWIVAELNRVLTWRWIKDPPPHRLPDDLSDANEK